MRERTKREYVVKLSITIICLFIVAVIFRFSGDDYQEQELIELDSVDAYHQHWYEVLDTNSDGEIDGELDGDYYDHYDRL